MALFSIVGGNCFGKTYLLERLNSLRVDAIQIELPPHSGKITLDQWILVLREIISLVFLPSIFRRFVYVWNRWGSFYLGLSKMKMDERALQFLDEGLLKKMIECVPFDESRMFNMKNNPKKYNWLTRILLIEKHWCDAFIILAPGRKRILENFEARNWKLSGLERAMVQQEWSLFVASSCERLKLPYQVLNKPNDRLSREEFYANISSSCKKIQGDPKKWG